MKFRCHNMEREVMNVIIKKSLRVLKVKAKC